MNKRDPYLSDSVQKLVQELAKLPGIGPRSAGRLVYHLLKSDQSRLRALSEAFHQVAERVVQCSGCGNYTDRSQDPCLICRDEKREKTVVCVVEQPFDIMVIERTGGFSGKYHVLGGALSPINGIGPEDLRIEPLLHRIGEDEVREVILATNPNVEGEATCLYLQKKLKSLPPDALGLSGLKVTKIARGLPIGSDLEYADEVTLSQALEGRVEL